MRKIALLSLLSVIPAAQAVVTIDDFTGEETRVEATEVHRPTYDSGIAADVPGGVRYLGQMINLPNESASAAAAHGRFAVSSATSGMTTTALAYGNIGITLVSAFGPNWWTNSGPNFSLGDYDTLRLNFLSNEQDLIVLLSVQTDEEYDVYEKLVAGNQFTPFSVDLLASDMREDHALASLSSFDTLHVEFRSSNGGDFELSSLQAVPEPATMAILGLGMAAAAARRRRK